MAAIIFDLDGTIADSFDYVSEFLAKEAKLPPLSAEQKDRLRSISMVGMARELGFKWWQAPYLLFKGRMRMRKRISHLNSFNGIPELIRKLHNEGHELFIVSTNSLRNVRHFLRIHDLRHYFLEVYGGVGLFGKAKTIKRLIKRQNFEVDNVVYVGDELRDIEAAQAAGIKIVAVSWGFASRDSLKAAKPTALVDTPDELMSFLEKI